jgi:hypothetical protein
MTYIGVTVQFAVFIFSTFSISFFTFSLENFDIGFLGFVDLD